MSHEELSLHFLQTPSSAFLSSLQFSSLELWLWHRVLALLHRKLGNWGAGMRSSCYLWAHYLNTGPIWAAEAATHTMLWFLMGQLSLSPGGALVGSCIVTLNLLIPPCRLLGISQLKDVPNELIWSKAMSMPFKDYLMHLRMLTPTSLRHTQYWQRLCRFCLVQWESKLYSNSSMCIYTNPMTSKQQYTFNCLDHWIFFRSLNHFFFFC